jgi:beta-phosphoglucomutase-like phosphatase (HAD superfamily)
LKAALLDLDGTVVDANDQHTLAWYRAFRGAGILTGGWAEQELLDVASNGST